MAFERLREDDEIEEGGQHWRRDRLHEHLPEAQQLLVEERKEARHLASGTPRPVRRRNTSSRSAPGKLLRRFSVVSSAATRPALSMAMRWQCASASSR